jgi:hypothetical protein
MFGRPVSVFRQKRVASLRQAFAEFHRTSGNEEAWNKIPASSFVNVISQNEYSGNAGGRKGEGLSLKRP